MRKYLAAFLIVALFAPAITWAKGSSGGRASFSSRSSSYSSSRSSSASSSRSTATTTRAAAVKPSSSPSSSTRTVASPVKTTSTGKQTTGKANIVDANYRPRFNGGYVPPVGSQVQYVQSSASFIDYLPWLYIFSQNHRDNVNRQEAVVTEPDGTEKSVVMEEDGVDGLLIFNWIVMILLTSGLIYGVFVLVNKYSNKK